MLDLKDMAMSALAMPILRKYIQPYGELETLHINSAAKRIVIQILPMGEQYPVNVTVYDGAIVSVEGKPFFTWESIKISRPWIQQLAEDFLPGKRVALPAAAAAILSKAL